MKSKKPAVVLRATRSLDLGAAWIRDALRLMEENQVGPESPEPGARLTEEEVLQANVAIGALSQLRKGIWEGGKTTS